ncbi:MAG TPA: O-antigen ligase family protein [Clostridia bacterium]|nr:O-antigen ligase family protein [Clostridia bacterium]
MTAEKALKCSIIIVVLLSVLFPVGAYFGVIAVFMAAIQARRSRQALSELASDNASLFMLVSFLLSCFFSRDRLMSLGALVLLCLNLGFYLVLVVELKKDGWEQYRRILDIGCTIVCIYGIYQFASGDLIMPKSWVDEKSFGSLARIYSTLLNPNILAAYLVMNLSLGISRLLSLGRDKLLMLNLPLASVCLLLTYSRGGFVAFFASMLALVLLNKRKRGIMLYTALMAAAFVVMNTGGNASRIGLSAVYRDSSSLYRIEIWKAAFDMFLTNPVMGHGPGTTWYYLSSGSDKLFSYILHSHNIYLQVAAELGITGVAAFGYLFARKAHEVMRLLGEKITVKEKCVLQGFAACLTGIAVHGLIDAVIFVPAFSLIFMGYAAVFGSILSAYSAKPSYRLSFEGEGVFKLLGGKGPGKKQYKEEEGETCEA